MDYISPNGHRIRVGPEDIKAGIEAVGDVTVKVARSLLAPVETPKVETPTLKPPVSDAELLREALRANDPESVPDPWSLPDPWDLGVELTTASAGTGARRMRPRL